MESTQAHEVQGVGGPKQSELPIHSVWVDHIHCKDYDVSLVSDWLSVVP